MEGKKWDVYVYGDINIDLVIPAVEKFPEPGQEDEIDTIETFVGGGAALFAMGIGKLGLRPVFQGEAGGDFYGELIKRTLIKRNVDCSLLTVNPMSKTGISLCFTNERDRAFLTYRGTNEEINIEHIDLEKVRQASHIHMTGYIGSKRHESYLKMLKRIKHETEVSVSFDLGWDSTGEWTDKLYELLPFIDVMFMNGTEALHYSRKSVHENAARDFAKACGLVVVKLGSAGSFAVKDGVMYKAPAYTVKAVDTTGAGDSFNAGFIYGYLKGKPIEECLKWGNGCGALCVTALGGNTAFPTEAELFEFLYKKV